MPRDTIDAISCIARHERETVELKPHRPEKRANQWSQVQRTAVGATLISGCRPTALRLLNETGDPDQDHRADKGDNDGTDQAPSWPDAEQPE